jgi:hypothetical protein
MLITEVIYRVKQKSCLSLKSVSFFIFTEDLSLARELALDELKKHTKYWERYAPICAYKRVVEV